MPCIIHDAPLVDEEGYLLPSAKDAMHPSHIAPTHQKFDFHDIGPERLDMAGNELGIEYLQQVPLSTSFPVQGVISPPNYRLFVNLVCKRSLQANENPAVNIVFVIHTASPITFVSCRAMEALIGLGSLQAPPYLMVQIQGKVVDAHLSPLGSEFEHVNVLGMDFLAENKLSLDLNFESNTITLGQPHDSLNSRP